MITTTGRLIDEQIGKYRADGYLVVHDLISPEEADAFTGHADTLVAPDFGLLGHASDPQYRYLAHHPAAVGIVAQLLDGPPRIVQTMYLNKPPRGGQGIALHQDTLYLPNEPNTLMACWIALTDTDPENGGLCVVPGSQRTGVRTAHKNENAAEHASWDFEYPMRDRNGREWTEKMFSFEIDDVRPEEIVRLTVPRCGAVFFSGTIIHGSYANRSADRQRKAFATHYVREGTWLFRQDVQNTMPVGVHDGSLERLR